MALRDLQYETLQNQVRQFHTILNMAWPKPSVPETAGGSWFIGTNISKMLTDGVQIIQHSLNALEDADVRRELNGFWKVLNELFVKIKNQKRDSRDKRTDPAINLLYLASGVFFHRIVELSPSQAPYDDRFVGVEEMSSLLHLCEWTGTDVSIKATFDAIIEAMTRIAIGLD